MPGAATILASDLVFSLVSGLWTAGIADEAVHSVTVAFADAGLYSIGLNAIATQTEAYFEQSWGTILQPVIVGCDEPPVFVCVSYQNVAFDTGPISGIATYNLIAGTQADIEVPEPASMAIMGIGLAALATRRRRPLRA